MRIVHMSSLLRWNDSRLFVKMCSSLAAAGHEVHAFALCTDFDEPAAHNGVIIHPLKPGPNRWARLVTLPRELFKRAAALNGDIYHFHEPRHLWRAALWQKKLKRPFIYDVHEDCRIRILDDPMWPQWSRRAISVSWGKQEDWGAARMAGLTAATPTIARLFTSHPHLAVIKNYPLLQELAPDVQGPPEKTPGLFVYAGGLTWPRGLTEMIQAIVMAGPEVTLALAGQFSPSEIQKDCENLPGWSQVRYQGFVNRDHLRRLYSQAVAGLVTLHLTGNHARSLPIKMFEYMSAGLPVIASDFPYWREIIQEAGCGLLVDPMKPGAIADAMKYLMDNPEKAAEMGRRGRAAVMSNYNWEMEFPKLTAFYERVLAGRLEK